MGRTRAALLEGAVRGIEKYGTRRLTMADVASLAGIAKATLYNHFRTKNDLLAAVVAEEVDSLTGECLTAADSTSSLVTAATRLSGHGALRRIAAEEPAVLARLATPESDGAWAAVREAIAEVLAAGGIQASTAAVETVVRWLVSFVLAPASEDEARVGAEALIAGLQGAST
jgi:AcrR family transcriptional regulator